MSITCYWCACDGLTLSRPQEAGYTHRIQGQLQPLRSYYHTSHTYTRQVMEMANIHVIQHPTRKTWQPRAQQDVAAQGSTNIPGNGEPYLVTRIHIYTKNRNRGSPSMHTLYKAHPPFPGEWHSSRTQQTDNPQPEAATLSLN
jgi:hypothetical protein